MNSVRNYIPFIESYAEGKSRERKKRFKVDAHS